MSDLSDPIAAFRAALDVIATEDWSAAADLVDPISLQFFVERLRARIAPPQPPQGPEAEDFMAHDPELPRAVAEHYANEARRHSDPLVRLREELPGIDTIEAFRALSPGELLAAWLDGRSGRRQVEELAATGQISADVAARRASGGFSIPHVAIGALPDGDDIAHVLYRRDLGPPRQRTEDGAGDPALEDIQRFVRDLSAYGHPSVAMMRRQPDGTWRLVLEHDFLNMSQSQIVDVRFIPNDE